MAKDLRARGDGEGGAEVKALRRPTVGAWAINQVVRRHPQEVKELLAAGRELRQAQGAAIAGTGGADVHAAASRRRAAVELLTRRTADVLKEAGRASGSLAEVSDTFLAASVEGGVAEVVKAGRLDRERRPTADVAELLGLSPAEEGP